MDAFGQHHRLLIAALCGFFILVAMIRHYARRSVLPAESWLLAVGIGYGLLAAETTTLPAIRLNPELVIGMLLPVLVFAEGRHLPIGLVLRAALPIALLVLLSMPLALAVIGLPIAWLAEIPLWHGLLFGAAVAATDPTTAGPVLGRFTIPQRLALLLQGESIFNDAITVVVFTTLVGVVLGAGDFSLGKVTIATLRSMLLAVPIGLLMGWLLGLLVRHWGEQNCMPGLTLTLALPIGTFLLSEHLLHASGIIAVVFSALAFSHSRHRQRTSEHELYNDFWEYLGTLGSSALYFALGASMGPQLLALNWRLALVIPLLLISRAVLIYGLGPLLRLQNCSLPANWSHVLMLGGLRGAVPAALILMLPLDYAYRDELLVMGFSLVAYSIIVHPVLLNLYLKNYSVSELPAQNAPTSTQPEAVMSGLSPWLSERFEASAWGMAAIAGVVAGVVFLILKMALVLLFQQVGPWVPVRMMAAIGLGPEVLPPPAGIALDVGLAAMVVHFTLSLSYAWLLAPFLEGIGLFKGILRGSLFGLLIYAVNFYLFTVLFPWFLQARTWDTIVAHLVFGAVLAMSYCGLRAAARKRAVSRKRGNV
ncbi:cation:proton antiporter [Vreelandella massiliensis]|uniref:cation:proton antiporter n=1 Tax=Vreelandella massiliensis TaxID=1816686 RepID=UPI00096A6C97|nr:sodium:proton antiporter [Halomonas massiliensis]